MCSRQTVVRDLVRALFAVFDTLQHFITSSLSCEHFLLGYTTTFNVNGNELSQDTFLYTWGVIHRHTRRHYQTFLTQVTYKLIECDGFLFAVAFSVSNKRQHSWHFALNNPTLSFRFHYPFVTGVVSIAGHNRQVNSLLFLCITDHIDLTSIFVGRVYEMVNYIHSGLPRFVTALYVVA